MMRVQFYGVRGSYPVPGPYTTTYGGNTTCVCITSKLDDGKISRVIIDSGTGIIQLGKELISDIFANKAKTELHILFTHLHPDHTQGFPFFAPNFLKNCEIHLYGMNALGSDIERILSAQMAPPNFPLEYRSLKSTRINHVVEDGDWIYIPGFSIKAMQAYAPSHPQQGALYYRIFDDDTKKSIACIWDLESKVGGDRAVIKFIEGCDVVIHDTQYTEEEYASDKMIVQGFGHSTYEMALQNAQAAKAKKLIGIHYNPSHTDGELDRIGRKYAQDMMLAKEGMWLDI